MINLPKWRLTNPFPAFLDSESGTAIEQTAKVYAAMQQLIDEYNNFVESVNAQLETFAEEIRTDHEEFETALRQEFQDFIDTVDMKLASLGGAAKIAEVTLRGSGWAGDASPYSQVVSIDSVTPYSQVNLTPSVEQLAIFHQQDLAFVTENDNGTVTVYAIGEKPTADHTMQVTITEVAI